jgi:hypothetical protein
LAAYPATIPPPRITNRDSLIHPPLRTIDPLIFSLRLLFSTSGLPEIPAQSVKVKTQPTRRMSKRLVARGRKGLRSHTIRNRTTGKTPGFQ